MALGVDDAADLAAAASPTVEVGGNGKGNESCPALAKLYAQKVPNKQFTLEEVRKHNTPEDAWIIVDDRVYRVTEWAKRHPGGAKTLTNLAGTDASDAYHGFHPADTYKKLSVFCIGSGEHRHIPPRMCPETCVDSHLTLRHVML